MSFAGLGQFNENLKAVMRSDAFKKASHSERAEMGHRLLSSKYGARSTATQPLKEKK